MPKARTAPEDEQETRESVVQRVNPRSNQAEENAVAAAARAGDEPAFTELAVRYRAELQVHCYRMLGSLEDSEALIRETFVRAWRRRETYQARSSFRAWLYRVSTNACLDFLTRKPYDGQLAMTGPGGETAPAAMIPWLQPYPDRLLDAAASKSDTAVTAEPTIEPAYVAAVQYLPPRQRAVLILRDVLGWPAKEAAIALETTVASVNSSLQRARPTLRRHLPVRRAPATVPGMSERAMLERYMAAIERSDDTALSGLLSENARAAQQPGAGGHDGPEPFLVEGRMAIIAAWAPALHGPHALAFRFMATRANRQPAAASYVRGEGESAFQPFGLSVLRLEAGTVTDVSTFPPDLFPAFGLPALL
ncbi:RNA polymerase subunit sigma-70 [Actinomadura sp. DC4]|uniref:RNA polymerase subunit sigma-70 n=1 Tax=Actinomadura sp. DC4 TaxID=3055069 RepID=UPI0025B18DC8|nr:RNA polymerase subunit sigma-70 [Actinomadura sp. DC4]MDN3352074.1 RNA polymerase subunit sigma-70 [Actinomadura sp. DC4]